MGFSNGCHHLGEGKFYPDVAPKVEPVLPLDPSQQKRPGCTVETLRTSRDFDRVFRRGKSLASRDLVIFYRKNHLGKLRVGFCVSKKLGKAVIRNKIKRRLREVFRACAFKIAPKWDLVLIARKSIASAKFHTLVENFQVLLQKADLTQGVPTKRTPVKKRFHR